MKALNKLPVALLLGLVPACGQSVHGPADRTDAAASADDDTGNTDDDTGNTDDDTGNTDDDTGNTDDDTGNTDDDTGNTDDDTGNTDDDTGNLDDDTGNTDDDVGNTDDDTGHADDDTGHADDDTGNADGGTPHQPDTGDRDAGARDAGDRDSGYPESGTPDASDDACAQAKLVLGAADDFVVLGGSTVTSTGSTSLTGDLGVSPGSTVIGFPPGTLVGVQHVNDATAAQAEADLTTAYNEAAGRVLCAVTVSGNIGGTTLAPGLYKSTSSLEISSGDLTLDAQGDPDGVFIFQMASTLTTTAGRQVILAGGAKSDNVYWQVGTSATLGSTSSFEGTVMADQAVTLETGAMLNGRVLSRIAAVTLDSNVIVKPAP
jgi:hypothetical protein